jgi:hypothetical protein
MISSTRAARATRASCGLLAAWLALSGCGEDMGEQPLEPDEPDMGERPDQTPSDGTGDGSGDGPPVVEAPPMHVAVNDMRSRAPMDATPSANGERIYYTALGTGDDGVSAPGVFAVAASGEGEIELLALGAPLTAPVGVSISPDGETLFLADSAWSGGDGAGVGAIVSLPSSGGTPQALAATQGYVPRGLVIAEVEGEDFVYFTGSDPTTGEPGAFRTTLGGGAVDVLASGAPFVDPAGIAVTHDGVVYVVDGLASSDGSGQAGVLRIEDGEAARMVEGLGVGFPAGIAVTTDASTVLVSGLDPTTRRDRVYLLDAKAAELSIITEPFSKFGEPAGLHRAHDQNTFAWADAEANGAGTVYVLSL